ncbi:MAG: 3-methyladenine DNA glycosylase [Mycobacteriaceae bacterium]|uniref:3-methyladenine DNA glycosylase n=1 Tax=Corynebacterium sp. TaxID=1720 RepID=UPI003F9DAD0E
MTEVTGILEPDRWRAVESDHRDHADALTADHRARRAAGERHPVWDFMFSYYPVKPSHLRRWSPGAGTALVADSGEPPAVSPLSTSGDSGRTLWTVDVASFLEKRGSTVAYIHRLLTATQQRPARFSCFGMHEWAMVYRDTPRHPEPLRLGRDATDRVVEDSSLCCTHIDAYRFFTPAAAPRNSVRPTRQTQADHEQPGCLHATMDLYKWATKLGPLVPGDLWLDTFRLACDVRRTDMEASPYDLSDWGFEPVAVETREGRAEYVRRQRDFAERGQDLRGRLLSITGSLPGHCYPEMERANVPS